MMPINLPTYGYAANAENEIARLQGWLAAFRWLILTNPYTPRGFRPSDALLHDLVVSWVRWHYGPPGGWLEPPRGRAWPERFDRLSGRDHA